MSATALAPGSISAQRQGRATRSRADARARLRSRAEPLIIFVLTAAALTALGIRDTVGLHLVYPDALTRLAHAYIAWWNNPPRFRSVGFVYPPLQGVALLPFALLRPLATSLVALPVFSALCAGAVVATLDRTLVVLELNWWIRLPLLIVFTANPLFLDYGANGMANCLVMALLAAGLHNFVAWYKHGGTSIRSLGFCGSWLAIAFLARYETVLWLVLVMIAVPLVRFRRGTSIVEVLALEAILAAPLVYIFLVWSGVSSLVGKGSLLSWITRAGSEHVSGLTYNGRLSFGSRAAGIVEVMWHSSPLLLIVPGLLVLAALLIRRPILLIVAASVVIGGAVSVLRMALLANPEVLTPGYQMIALVPMLIGAGWLISLVPRGGPGAAGLTRGILGLAALAGLLVSLETSYGLMKNDHNQYDRAFTQALSSHLKRITPADGNSAASGPVNVYADTKGLATFFQAAVYTQKTVLVDDLAFPGLVLAEDTVDPYRTRAEDGDAPWTRFLDHPRTRGKLEYLVVANPKLTAQGYPSDLIARHYPTAYSGHLAHTAVIYRNPLVAVVQLLPRTSPAAKLLPGSQTQLLTLYQDLPQLSHKAPFSTRIAKHRAVKRGTAKRGTVKRRRVNRRRR